MNDLRFEHRIDNRKQDRYVTQDGDGRRLIVRERGSHDVVWELRVPEEWKGRWVWQLIDSFPSLYIVIDVVMDVPGSAGQPSTEPSNSRSQRRSR